MGITCSGKQKATKKDDYTTIKVENTTLKQSLEFEQAQLKHNPERTKEMIRISKKFSGLLDLIGNLDQLQPVTRDQIKSLVLVRSNIDILTQNTLRRALRSKNIIRQVQQEDEQFLYDDKKYAATLKNYLKRASESIQQLKYNSDFESIFPILCVSFQELSTFIESLE